MFEPGREKTGGKKKGFKSGYSRQEIEAAFEDAKVKHGGISLLEHLCDLAYEDKAVAISMMRKLVPDLRSLQLEIDGLSEDEWAERQAKSLLMMQRSTDGSAHLMNQVKDLLCRMKIGTVIDAGIMAEIEPMIPGLEGYSTYELTTIDEPLSLAGDTAQEVENGQQE